MNSRRGWLCDGVSKNGKQYPGLYRAHQPYENYGSHCQICGKPREAMIPNTPSRRVVQQGVSLRNKAISSPKTILSANLQLILLLGIPTVSVILAIYVMLSPFWKQRIELAQDYENTNYGIKIKYPQNWKLQDKEDPAFTGDIAILVPPEAKEDDCQVSMTIAVDEFQGNSPSIEDYKNSVKEKINTLNPNTKIADESASAKLSNSSAYKLVYPRQDGQCNLQVMEIGTIKNNKAYYITYKASANVYDNFLKPVEEIINSIEIKEANKQN